MNRSYESKIREELIQYLSKSSKLDMNAFKSGIYLLFNSDVLVYIGQAKCVAERLVKHYKDTEKTFDDVRYINVPEEDLNEYETALIKIFNPKLNIHKANRYGINWALSKALHIINS